MKNQIEGEDIFGKKIFDNFIYPLIFRYSAFDYPKQFNKFTS